MIVCNCYSELSSTNSKDDGSHDISVKTSY